MLKPIANVQSKDRRYEIMSNGEWRLMNFIHNKFVSDGVCRCARCDRFRQMKVAEIIQEGAAIGPKEQI